MGFIEETGAAQHLRDARILPIYEGTNGIQANDFLFRKVLRDGGAEAKSFLKDIGAFLPLLKKKPSDDLDAIHDALEKASAEVAKTTEWMIANAKSNTDAVAAAVVPYLRQFSLLAGGWMMAQMALAAYNALQSSDEDALFCNTKMVTARFFAEALMPGIYGLSAPIMGGHKLVGQIANDQF
jgi:hypothetical protein